MENNEIEKCVDTGWTIWRLFTFCDLMLLLRLCFYDGHELDSNLYICILDLLCSQLKSNCDVSYTKLFFFLFFIFHGNHDSILMMKGKNSQLNFKRFKIYINASIVWYLTNIIEVNAKYGIYLDNNKWHFKDMKFTNA